jgi:hypothetical protein
MTLDLNSFTSQSATTCHEFVIRTYVPVEDVDKTLQAIAEVTPLRYGSYENVAFQSAAGTQKFRPLSGSHLGSASKVFDFPVVELVFAIPHDEELLKATVDKIFAVHIAEEPVIYINESWSTRARDYSDIANPNRFWNRPDFNDENSW